MHSLGDVFGRLKPLFEKVVQDPTLADIKRLNECLDQIDKSSLQILQNVFLQQLVVLVDGISKENKNELKTQLIECICTILQKTKIRQAVAMKTTAIVLTKQIYDARSGHLVGDLSEELKMVTLRGLTLVSKAIQSDLVEVVYVRDNLNLISQVLFVCVSLLGVEKYRKLRSQAIECIMATMQVHDEFDLADVVLRCQIAELLFIVLPKLLMAMVSVINGDPKQGKAVIGIGIKALGRILGIIFEDYDGDHREEEIETKDFIKLSKNIESLNIKGRNILGMGLKDSKAKEEYFCNTTRSREWLLEAEKKVHAVLVTISHQRGAEEESIRQEYARMNAELLQKCATNMPTCSVIFLESLLALSQDDSSKVRDICEEGLKRLSQSGVSFGPSRMDELFYDSLQPIVRTIYRGEETEQIASFRLLKGYIHFLSEHQLSLILSNQEILNQLVSILVCGAELDQTDELVRREYVSYRFEYALDENKLEKEKRESRWIILRNFNGSDRSRKSFLDLIKSFHHRPEALSRILNYILEDLFTTKFNTNGYLFLLSELVPSEAKGNRTIVEIFKNVFMEILQSYHWELNLEEATNVSDLKFNALHICLSLRLIARYSLLFHEDFRWQLYGVLGHVLPLSGSSLNCVNEAAEMALEAIAESQGMTSIHELIFHNLDYIAQHVSHSLRHSCSFSIGVHMLESVLRFVPYESSAILESTISPIVMDILESHDRRVGERRILCLRVLHIFVRAIRYRYRAELQKAESDPNVIAKKALEDKIAQLKQELEHKLPEAGATIEEVFDGEPNETDQPEGEPESVEPYQSEEQKLPPHIRITMEILTVNFKYLASSVTDERIVVLGTLNEGIHLLKEHENQLLPLVHQIWFNFAERFADTSPVVIGCAFDLLVSLAELAKDFIRKRTLDDVMPRLNAFMRDSVSADYSARQTFNLQRKVLTHAPALVASLKLNERQLDQVLEVGKLYLQRSERRELQQLAKLFLDRLREYDSGAVFIKLNASKRGN
ncbi:TELO2-interacting protein 1 homolog [Toxorhynchites rutilus septentrionalis]|uniref:TELO2-interacting protein 1 homolog n=1 Tax=Toxorhynchites rutilus septentrionalis TaxID=329112 RepID=UPI00247A6248|nr:TELO2-interacting protein 1 homolog [Toxorhynchites rutilus septentrionalis]